MPGCPLASGSGLAIQGVGSGALSAGRRARQCACRVSPGRAALRWSWRSAPSRRRRGRGRGWEGSSRGASRLGPRPARTVQGFCNAAPGRASGHRRAGTEHQATAHVSRSEQDVGRGGAGQLPPASRMARAPKPTHRGAKRKKNDPRAQLEWLVQGGKCAASPTCSARRRSDEFTLTTSRDAGHPRRLQNGDKDMIRELMKRNCFLNQKDSKGCTALMLAAAAGHDKIVKLIVDGGADVRMKDRNDDTALEYAEKNNRTKVKELLNLYACEYTW